MKVYGSFATSVNIHR